MKTRERSIPVTGSVAVILRFACGLLSVALRGACAEIPTEDSVASDSAPSEPLEQSLADAVAADLRPRISRNVATGFCLDSDTNGSVYTLDCNRGNFQNWNRTPPAAKEQQLRSVATGFCLDSNTDGEVYTLACNGGNFQRWRRDKGRFINVATGLCLDSDTSGRVYTLACNGGAFQRWE